jgi:hypothetical protein
MPRQQFDGEPPPKILLLFFGGFFFFAFGVFAASAIMSGDIPGAIIEIFMGALIIVYLVLCFTNPDFVLRTSTFVTVSPLLLLLLVLLIWEFFHRID